MAAEGRLEIQVRMGWGSAMNVCTDPHLLCDDTALFSSPAIPEHVKVDMKMLASLAKHFFKSVDLEYDRILLPRCSALWVILQNETAH